MFLFDKAAVSSGSGDPEPSFRQAAQAEGEHPMMH